jgi:phosphoglycolate phosphatase
MRQEAHARPSPLGSGVGRTSLLMLDYDGVIVDSVDVYCRIVPPLLAKYGLPRLASREDIVALDDGNWFESLAAAGVPMSVATTIEAAVAEVVTMGGLEPFDGIRDVIGRLAEQHVVVIVTSSHGAVVRDFLGQHDIGGVRAILGSDEGTSKVRKIHEARARFGRGLDAWYIGDTVGDIREARMAGVPVIAAAWGWHSLQRLQSASPDRIAYTPGDLISLLC